VTRPVCRRKKIRPLKPSPAWQQGVIARAGKLGADANPYERQTDRWYRWREGREYEDQEIGAGR